MKLFDRRRTVRIEHELGDRFGSVLVRSTVAVEVEIQGKRLLVGRFPDVHYQLTSCSSADLEQGCAALAFSGGGEGGSLVLERFSPERVQLVASTVASHNVPSRRWPVGVVAVPAGTTLSLVLEPPPRPATSSPQTVEVEARLRRGAASLDVGVVVRDGTTSRRLWLGTLRGSPTSTLPPKCSVARGDAWEGTWIHVQCPTWGDIELVPVDSTRVRTVLLDGQGYRLGPLLPVSSQRATDVVIEPVG